MADVHLVEAGEIVEGRFSENEIADGDEVAIVWSSGLTIQARVYQGPHGMYFENAQYIGGLRYVGDRWEPYAVEAKQAGPQLQLIEV